MPCDGLLRFARNDAERTSAIPILVLVGETTSSRIRTAHQFLHHLVDGIFTTFIAGLFTNTSDAIRENHAASCV
jgi:hypothetical protein